MNFRVKIRYFLLEDSNYLIGDFKIMWHLCIRAGILH